MNSAERDSPGPLESCFRVEDQIFESGDVDETGAVSGDGWVSQTECMAVGRRRLLPNSRLLRDRLVPVS